jgi:hypothetical protein
MTNGSEQMPEGVRIPRPESYPDDPARKAIEAIHADRAKRLRHVGLAAGLTARGLTAVARHDGVLLTEDAARAVLDRLEGK